MSSKTSSLLTASKLGAACLAAVAAISLAGCVSDPIATSSITTDDYRARHPIVLANAPTTLDVFPAGDHTIDAASIQDIRAFAERYRRFGTGRMYILSPWGGGYRTRAAVGEIRRVLASSGLGGFIGVGSYRVAAPSAAAPIRLSFRGLKAEVASVCGQWPDDLASGGTTVGWKNESYYNFGCATQSMLAAQVDDPRDFDHARALGPADEEMRLRAIKDVRQGQDPGTDWKVKLTPIGAVGGN